MPLAGECPHSFHWQAGLPADDPASLMLEKGVSESLPYLVRAFNKDKYITFTKFVKAVFPAGNKS